ncbi:hypothetical protein K493DRAFT_310671 [Basidiobolus meristosporus CBS 931.73]|uniref:Uncharacterized protein n=1 Tax=Basidiobolus meristosporus CBS 931.73 TaxID=1314790 RepID=A0A1Y1Z8M4_9FUNG|nr:hypothetical protein K493DRAFT_310671 [Basidiobolus meristosporus CBS 931.73]|eukprot:ORY06357.1 hypothetical protein K493DRAFT_310671 [Basidiobolus meristosporus CBS 931.73]
MEHSVAHGQPLVARTPLKFQEISGCRVHAQIKVPSKWKTNDLLEATYFATPLCHAARPSTGTIIGSTNC